jgi:hypothetical protein
MQRTIRTLIIIAISGMMVWLSANQLPADMQMLDDIDMAAIDGTGGLSIGLDNIAFYLQADKVSYTDTDTGNALELGHLTISNGRGEPATIHAGNADVNHDGLMSPLTFDVVTISDPLSPAYGKAVTVFQALDWLEEAHLHVEELRFCNQELGRLDIGVIHRPSFYWVVGAHDSGVDFEYGAQVSVDALRLTYNSQNENLAFSGIHLASQIAGLPERPDQWQLDGNFQIGALYEGRPATFDVGKDDAGMVGIEMNLPMQGSLRAENIQWAGQDFGPMAIDGIQVHRLNVRFMP